MSLPHRGAPGDNQRSMSAVPPIGADAVIPPRRAPVREWFRLVGLRVRARGRLTVDGRPRVAAGARVSVAPGGRVRLGDGCLLGAGARIEAAGGTVEVGPGARLGDRAVVVALESVTLDRDAVLGDWALACDAGPAWADAETPVRSQPPRRRPLRIGDGARIGAHAAVLADVPDGAVVASYAVVTDDVSSP
jgi:acetyltransferase-like isoleucine patch superfamily enzyme